MDIDDAFVELIRLCATDLPKDVEDALKAAQKSEKKGGVAYSTLGSILDNVKIARKGSVPMCQDTGVAIFWVRHGPGHSQLELRLRLTEAVRSATNLSYLRPNSVSGLTGENSGDNTGVGVPVFHFEEWEQDEVRVELLLKGGGSENVSRQYALPSDALKAGRDLEGVRRCVLDAAFQAQGKGCSPGFLGVSISGSRDTGFEMAKHALLRKVKDRNPEPALAKLEAALTKELNTLGIGPMGLGGKTTVLGVKAVAGHRHPASFIVSIAYNCWALRRHTLTYIDGGEARYD